MFRHLFIEGWQLNILLYGIVFLLAQHVVYKVIFRPLIGQPKTYYFEDVQHWRRKASFLGAVIFAPLFEEVMFTYLAYASFLKYAVAGKEGIVILFVAGFFAILHFPGDFRQMGYRLTPWIAYRLFKFQLDRFFFSVTAYFVYQETAYLWVTIGLHYFINAIVSLYNFDLEDPRVPVEKNDGILLLIRLTNSSLVLASIYFLFLYFPSLGVYVLPFGLALLGDYLYWHLKTP